MYFQLTANPAATFPMTPVVGLTGLTDVTGCFFYGYTNNSGWTFSWTPISPQTQAAVVSNGNVTIPAVNPGGSVTLNSTPFFGAIVCS
jgi:hypothetical protein